MTAYEFMGEHPVLTFFLALLALSLVKLPFRLVNIAVRGWPPAHCDADGDCRKD